MKKLFYIFIALFLVNGVVGQRSIPASSFDASSKITDPSFNLQHRTLNSLVNVQGITGNTEQRSLIQIYDSIYYWIWDTLSIGWQIDEKTIDMVYDDINNLISDKNLKWIGSDWMNYSLDTYTYDVNSNQTSKLSQNWNGSNWDNWLLNTFTYDASNNLTSSLRQFWNSATWENQTLLTYTYNTSNNWITYLVQLWNNSTWENYYKWTRTYDVNNNMMSDLIQVWNGSDWMNLQLATYTYDANNILISKLWQDWNGSSWGNSTLSTYTYDANNNVISILLEDWNGSGWENGWLQTLTYDANNNLLSVLVEEWNGSAWVYLEQYSYTYDANNFKVSDSYKFYGPNSIKVTEGDSTYCYFHTAVVGKNELMSPIGNISVYPNPSSGKITIETATNGHLFILDLNGQQLLQQEITESTTIVDVSWLPSGIYIVKIAGEKGVQVGKYVKQ
jgi:hypothetical protein